MKIAIPTNRPEDVENYVNAMTGLGAEPIIIGGAECPEGHLRAADEQAMAQCAGLLLPGGVDVEPALYGQEKGPLTKTEPALDRLQTEALRCFLEMGRPVFGICRGHQLLNVYFGGTLIQHLETAKDHVQKGPGNDNVHGCAAEADSFLGRLYGERFSINSSHHQAVDRPGKGLRIVARSEGDGVVEALAHESLPVWSVQFHPERMCFGHRREDTVDGSEVLKFFLGEC